MEKKKKLNKKCIRNLAVIRAEISVTNLSKLNKNKMGIDYFHKIIMGTFSLHLASSFWAAANKHQVEVSPGCEAAELHVASNVN